MQEVPKRTLETDFGDTILVLRSEQRPACLPQGQASRSKYWMLPEHEASLQGLVHDNGHVTKHLHEEHGGSLLLQPRLRKTLQLLQGSARIEENLTTTSSPMRIVGYRHKQTILQLIIKDKRTTRVTHREWHTTQNGCNEHTNASSRRLRARSPSTASPTLLKK